MRQLIYTSTSTAPAGKADLDGILEQSRHNNAIDGITGLLWSDGTRFMQVIEGPEVSVEAAFARIQADSRHRDIDVHRDAPVEQREFGDWTMAGRRARDPSGAYDARMRLLLRNASPTIKEPFLALIAAGQR